MKRIRFVISFNISDTQNCFNILNSELSSFWGQIRFMQKGSLMKSYNVNMRFNLTITTSRYFEFITYKSSPENG